MAHNSLSRRHRRWLASSLLATISCAAASVALAQDAGSDGDDIVVNGKALPGAVIGDIPPENQLRPADIAAYGVGTVNELLDQITEQTQSDQGRDSSAGPVILVNGKRVSGVNEVGDLPTESILRVDILPEEVAIKYGYDAQQKVVNIILRRHFRSTVANLTGGAATEGAGENEGGDLGYTRIHDNDRVNITGRVKTTASMLESDRGVSSTTGSAVDPTGQIANDSQYRTLEPSTRTYTLNGVFAHQLSSKITASFNARGTYGTSDALNGLASDTLSVPATSPYATSGSDTVIDRYLSTRALGQSVTTATAHAGVTLNADLSKKWKLSFIGAYDYSDVRTGTDRGYDITALQDGIDAGEIDPYGALSSSVLGAVQRQRATALTDTGSASLLATGTLFPLPAGDVHTSVKIGGDFSNLDSTTTGADFARSSSLSRTDLDGQISFDLPLTSRKKHVLGAIGDLSLNLNGAVTHVSGYGALGTFGYGLHWTPRTGISVIASVNEDRVAPTLAQLNNPTITTSNVRLYDYVKGETVTVSQITGGNPDLKADDRHVFKLGLSVTPFKKMKLNLVADYIRSVTHNAIGTLTSPTAEAEAAFPDRYIRDEDGNLTEVDARALNFAREDRQELRWGINFTKVLRAPKRPPPPPGGWQHFREMREQQREREGGGAGTATGTGAPSGQDDAAQKARNLAAAQQAGSGRGPGDDGAPPPPDQDIVVNGQKTHDGGGDFGPPPPDDGDGFGRRRGGAGDGFGPPDGPPPGGPPPDGFGGPGGPGGPGGHGGPPGGRGGFGGGNGAQFDFSFYHSWYFRDDVLLREGMPVIDLLNGGTIGSGGQPRHKIQMNTGVVDNGVGLRLSGTWESATRVDEDSAANAGPLHFSSLMTFDLRLFANLQQRFPGKTWARGMRLTFAVGNLFDTRQKVHDATGATPLIYQPALLDPYGRTISVTLRRMF